MPSGLIKTVVSLAYVFTQSIKLIVYNSVRVCMIELS